MSFDGIVTRAVTYELKNKILGGKIQRISQPSKNDLILNIYSLGKSYKLLLSANNNEARINLSDEKFENPITPPNFCMVLRKHLNQSKIFDIKQYKMDRVIVFHISSIDEMGFDVSNKLIVEIMGKYSNIILTDENYKIIDSIKRVNYKMSSVREILPGLDYRFIESEKINILEDDFKDDILKLDKNISDNQNPTKFLYETYLGFSPTVAKELIYKSKIDSRINWELVSEDEKKLLNENLFILREKLINNDYNPIAYKNKSKIKEFYSFNLDSNNFEKEYYDSMSKAIEKFYSVNKSNDRLRQIKNDLERKINSHRKAVKNKISILEKNLSKEKTMDNYRQKGDLLASNINKIEKGLTSIKLKSFYNDEYIELALDPLKNPWENVDSYYKRYKKIKNSIDFAKIDLPKQKSFLEYLNQSLDFIERCDSINDLDEIKEELIENSIIKDKQKNKKNKKSKSKPKHFKTNNNSHIYVGKNSRQNDYITLKLANKNDYFFHVRNAPGSHVILKTDKMINEDDIKVAAYLAAINSSLSNSNKVDIDFTEKKNVNKPKGAKLGMVYYVDFKTITVDLSENPSNLYKKID